MPQKLLATKGELFMPDGSIILVRYPEGDCDSIPWPFKKEKDKHNLASALYGSFECGEITERTVLLPNGEEFNIDANVGEPKKRERHFEF